MTSFITQLMQTRISHFKHVTEVGICHIKKHKHFCIPFFLNVSYKLHAKTFSSLYHFNKGLRYFNKFK